MNYQDHYEKQEELHYLTVLAEFEDVEAIFYLEKIDENEIFKLISCVENSFIFLTQCGRESIIIEFNDLPHLLVFTYMKVSDLIDFFNTDEVKSFRVEILSDNNI